MSDAKQDFIDEVMRLAGKYADPNPFHDRAAELKAFLQERIGDPVLHSEDSSKDGTLKRNTKILYSLDGEQK